MTVLSDYRTVLLTHLTEKNICIKFFLQVKLKIIDKFYAVFTFVLKRDYQLFLIVYFQRNEYYFEKRFLEARWDKIVWWFLSMLPKVSTYTNYIQNHYYY